MARKTAFITPAQEVANRINAQLKSDVVKMASDDRYQIRRVPTGSPTIDRLTGGGFARGRHVECFGDWLVGKSLLAYMTLVLAQERGEICAVVDPENVFDAAWFTQLGGNVEDLLMPEFQTANQMGNALRLFTQTGEGIRPVDIVLVDSVASLVTDEEITHDLEEGDARVASLARLMSFMLRLITMPNNHTLFIWTNQWRDKISRIPGQKSTPGGHALPFYASSRIEMMKAEAETEERQIWRAGKLTNRKVRIGQWVNCTVKKEKTGAQPEQSRAVLLDYETRRFDIAREIIDLGLEDEIITRSGDHFEVALPDGGTKRLHGVKRTRAFISEDDEVREFLLSAIEERTLELVSGEA